jgi:hypothetical protein
MSEVPLYGRVVQNAVIRLTLDRSKGTAEFVLVVEKAF